jgi:hypothetical protein
LSDGRFFVSGTTRDAFGVPIRSRAIALTASTARNGLGFFFFAISPESKPAMAAQI